MMSVVLRDVTVSLKGCHDAAYSRMLTPACCFNFVALASTCNCACQPALVPVHVEVRTRRFIEFNLSLRVVRTFAS
jgi:hypothetical protein